MTSTSLRIRNVLPAVCIALAGLTLGGGCTTMQDHYETTGRQYDTVMARPRGMIDKYFRKTKTQFDPVMADPPADSASMARNWEPVAYVYPSGQVIAGPTYQINYEDRPQFLANDYAYAFASPVLLGLDALAMPFGMVIEPPFTKEVYHGARYAPSMTIAPPLPEAIPFRSVDAPVLNPGPDAPTPTRSTGLDNPIPAPRSTTPQP